MIDVDHFHAYNETHGHPAGDIALRQIAHVLKTTVKKQWDVVARYGGEEYVVLLPQADPATAKRVAERLRKKVSELTLQTGTPVTISLGVATYPQHGAHPKEILSAADQALFQAKKQGRNGVYVFV